MTSNPSLAYPAEYYYPEFIDNRPGDAHQPPPSNIPLTTSVDNGIGATTKTPTNITTITKKPVTKKQTPKSLALDVVTDQGLPDTDMTQAVKTDPKRNLLRDPAEKNIPRLIVDESVLKQAVRTPRIVTTNLDNDFEQTTNSFPISNGTTNPYPINNGMTNSYPINNAIKPLANGHMNGDLTNKIPARGPKKQQTIKYVEDEKPIDDYWKKEVYIDDEGVVTIEPLKYDRNTYDGPFGLSRRGSFIFYITLGIFTLLAAVFLIMTGVFYSKNYPDATGNTGKLAGIGICGLSFYLGLQLILIGLWHQKYRQENPKQIVRKPQQHNDSSAHLKSSMEENEPYDYSYQQPYDYTAYGDYSNPPYASNVNEQMLLQQPGAVTGAAYYEPVVWPSNVEVEAQPDSKFLQPMEWSYGTQPRTIESPSTAIGYTAPSIATTNDKPEKKKHRHHRHHNKKTVEADPPKAKFDNLLADSSVIEAPLPVLNKAPETTELLKTIAEMEKNTQHTSSNGAFTKQNSNRIQPIDNGTDISSINGHKNHHHHHSRRHHHDHHDNHDNHDNHDHRDHHDNHDHHDHHDHHGHHDHHDHHEHRDHHDHHDHHGHHHQHQQHRHHSYSPCSTCSNRSHNDFRSDVGLNHNHNHNHNHHHHHPYQHQHSAPIEKIITPRSHRARTPSPPRRNTTVYRDTGIGTGLETKIMKDSSVTADLEDVPHARDNRLEQIPIVRRTIIVEPYPAEPSSQIVVKPRSDMIGKIRLGKNQKLNGDDETIVYPSTAFTNKKSKKKKKTTGNNNKHIEDLKLEDVNDDSNYDDENEKSKKRNTTKGSSRKNVKNAFYN